MGKSPGVSGKGALPLILCAVGALGANGGPVATHQDVLPPVGVELVQIDAVVTDKQGRPVPGLTKVDFEIREDGKLQDLSVFSNESHLGGEGAADAAAVPEPGLATPGVPVAKVRGRQIVIAVDDLHMTPANLVSTRKALLKFVDEQLSAEDQVALVTTSGAVGLSQELTSERTALRKAIERLNLLQERRVELDEVPHLTEYQAELIDRGDPEAIRLAVQEIRQDNGDVDEPLARQQAGRVAQRMLFEIMNYSGQTLSALEGVVRGLAPLSGRKLVVLVSDGFLIGLGSSDTRHYDLRRIIDAATRSGVVLYALDSRGLVSEVPGGNASFSGPAVITAPGVRESLQSRSIEALRDSLVALSEDTGGFLVKNSNDLAAGFLRILRDNVLYYVLGYEPTNKKRDGKFRKIEVRLVSRPELKDLKVRTRRGYFAAAEPKASAKDRSAEVESSQRDRQFAQALGSLIPLTGIPVRLAVDYVDVPPDGSRAIVKAEIDVRNVGFERTAEAYQAELEVAGAVFDESGRRVAEIAGERSRLRLPLENTQALREQGLAYEKAVALGPGHYEVRLAVRDVRTALLGNASAEIEIPDRQVHPVSLSSIFLSADDGAPEGQRTLTDVQVRKRFKAPQGLHYLVYVYRSDAAAREPAEVTLQAQLWSGDKLQGVGPSHKVAFADPGAPVPRQAERIALDALAPGTYELRIVVKGSPAAERAERRVTFTLE